MMDWFKMQTVWGASVERLSDAEAGRFIKALYGYVRDGVEYEGSSGREDPLTWLALEALREDVESFKEKEANQKEKEEAIKEKRREAAKTRWMQNDANESKCMQKHASADGCIICNASASENKNKDIYIKENPLTGVKEKRTRFSPPALEEVQAYCQERKNGIDAQHFVDYYAARGWELKPGQKVKDWKACIRTWEQRKNNPAQAPIKQVRANQYQQRPYDEAELEDRLGVNDLFSADYKGVS